jgi:hypothetical protein
MDGTVCVSVCVFKKKKKKKLAERRTQNEGNLSDIECFRSIKPR